MIETFFSKKNLIEFIPFIAVIASFIVFSNARPAVLGSAIILSGGSARIALLWLGSRKKK